jgi:hypothetical protein
VNGVSQRRIREKCYVGGGEEVGGRQQIAQFFSFLFLTAG